MITMNYPDCFQKTALATLIGMAFVPHSAQAELDFAHSPPGTAAPYVAPNVILSLDDSGSMVDENNYMIVDGKKKSRAQVLKEAVEDVFNDKVLLPDGKIRLAWQDMSRSEAGNTMYPRYASRVYVDEGRNFNCTNPSPLKIGPLGAGAASSGTYDNSMRILDENHRTNFLSYISKFNACGMTPTHLMVKRADEYMRAPISNKHSPWADIPGEKLADPANDNKPLGCRRNYHILLTDGGWNWAYRMTDPTEDYGLTNRPPKESNVNFDNTERTLPNGVLYATTGAAAEQTRIYRGEEYLGEPIHNGKKYTREWYFNTMLSDWAMKSWADPLQDAKNLHGMVTPSADFKAAPETETVTNRITQKSFTFEKFWNPKYNPATWPHMSTFTIGFSDDALPRVNVNDVECWNKYDSSCVVGNVLSPTSVVPYGDDGNLADYASGTYLWNANNWDNRGHDMWHSAINGRGRFYAVSKGEDLKKAFRDIIETINIEVTGAYASTAASGYNAMRNDIGIFAAEYDPTKGWSGKISAKTYNVKTQKHENAWGNETTAGKLDNLSNIDSRFILTANEMLTPDGDFIGREGSLFKWSSLGAAEKAAIGSSEETPVVKSGKHIVNYIRGEREQEGSTADKPFRKRTSRQGDIVNSSIWYLAEPADITHMSRKGYTAFSRKWKNRTPMLYVGGNDGMLHGFSAADGTEKIAYVPHGLLSQIPQLAQHSFDGNHRYFVDGSPFSGDVYQRENDQWKTMLVGTLGAGGKGYFVLDVTNPEDFTDNNATKLVVKDMTLPPGEGDWDEPGEGLLGHIFAKPVMDDDNPQRTVQIAQLNNDRYAAILGNGYGSNSGTAALLIQYLDGDKEMLAITTPIPVDSRPDDLPPNGLSAPRLVDINGDGRPDVVYAGDLRGNLWKFLINTGNDEDWDVAYWYNTGNAPLFIANRGEGHSENTSNSTLQSIVAAPSVKISDRSKKVTVGGKEEIVPVVGMMVSFGTGRNITTQDPQEQQQQTLYSVLDNTSYALEKKGGKATGRVLVCKDTTPPCDNLVKSNADRPHSVAQSSLVQRSISDTPKEKDGEKYWDLEAPEPVDFAENNGWFLDFPLTGERLLKNMSFYDGSNLLMVMSQIPAKEGGDAPAVGVESCESGPAEGSSQYVTWINIHNGQASTEDLLPSPGSSRMDVVSDDAGALPPLVGNFAPDNSEACTKDGDCSVTPVTGLGNLDGTKMKTANLLREEPLRSSWRQMK